MIPIAAVVGLTIVLWSLVHGGFAWFFQARIVAGRIDVQETEAESRYRPKASVLMSLRGCDPFLEQNLTGLLEQSYQDFEIIVVIDNHQDPAWRVVENVKETLDVSDRLRMFELKDASSQCSLKCSSMIQASQEISPDCEVIVLVDADVVPHSSWLRDAVRPLANPTVGVVTGSQWFSPRHADTGSLLRSLWNAGAMVATAINANPWAGTCAMRVVDLRESGLVEKWRSSVVDDGPIKASFARLGLKVLFEPRLLMVNRDQCSTAFVGRYVTRMLTWSRIYEATFINTVIHAMCMFGLLVTVIVTVGMSLWTKNWLAFAIIASAAVLSNFVMFAGFRIVENAVRQAIASRSRCNRLEPMTLPKAIRVLCLLPICQFAHFAWTIQAIFVRQVCWRDITYSLRRQQKVEMVAYRPYVADGRTSSGSHASI